MTRFIHQPRPRQGCLRAAAVAGLVSLAAAAPLAALAQAKTAGATIRPPVVQPTGIAPVMDCTTSSIGSVTLTSDLPTLPTTNPPGDTSVTITSVTTGTTGGIPYCLVKLLVKPAINIWVAMPTGGNWNGRLQSEGGGGYAGSVGIATASVAGGYIGIQTDTGHTGGSGSFGMLTPVPNGAPDVQLQSDFAFRSEHLMAVLGKQLAQAFYSQQPAYSYWNGCSTGGRQGLRMAQQFPNDYDGMLIAALAIHWDRFIAAEIWPQVAMRNNTGAAIANGKLTLATNAAIAACDAQDGVVDSLLTWPQACTYNPVNDATITLASCTSADNTCLSPAEADAIQKIWSGPTSTKGKSLWFGLERGAALNGLGGTSPFSVATAHGQYWTYFDPSWDWKTLTYANYENYFKAAMQQINPMMASENPDLSAYRNRGGKIVMWHGLADQLIFPRGSVLYYDAVTSQLGGGYAATQQWFRHFTLPGVAHCSGGTGPQPVSFFQSVVNWVENGQAPDALLTSKSLGGGATMTRPVCPYPARATYTGSGSTDDAANFVCAP
jgi:hypothetical protein